MKSLYVECLNCTCCYPTGFQAEQATQLIGLSYICPKCQAITRCSPSRYLEKIDGDYRRAMKEEETFALPPVKRIDVMGPDVYEFKSEVIVKPGICITSYRGLIRYTEGQ